MLRKSETKTIVDCHTHAGSPDMANRARNFQPAEQQIKELKEKLAVAGVNRAIVFPFPSTTYYDVDIFNKEKRLVPSGQQPFPYAVENQELLEQCQGEKSFYPFACIDPREQTEKQLRFLSSLVGKKKKIFGLKLHGVTMQSSALDLENTGFVDFALANNLPIIFHSGRDQYSLPEHALSLAKRHPKLRVDLAHFALFDNVILGQLPGHPNVFVDSSPLLYLSDMAKEGSRWVTEPNFIVLDSPALTLFEYYQRLQSQFLWGTDEPYTRMVTPDGIVRSNHTYLEEANTLRSLEKLMPTAVRSIAQDNTLAFLFG